MISLRDHMDADEGWGREQGRRVFQHLLARRGGMRAGCLQSVDAECNAH